MTNTQIIYQIYKDREYKLYQLDLKRLKEIWTDLLELINRSIYSRNHIISLIKDYFSNPFIILFQRIKYIYNLLVEFEAADQLLSSTVLTCLFVKKKPTKKSLLEIYQTESKTRVQILYERSESILGGWILIDEEGNIIDRSFAFVNFIK